MFRNSILQHLMSMFFLLVLFLCSYVTDLKRTLLMYVFIQKRKKKVFFVCILKQKLPYLLVSVLCTRFQVP